MSAWHTIGAAAAVLAMIALSSPAMAHAGHGYGGGFASGFLHPVAGWDHVAAMVAVGLWGAFLGAPSIWLLPIVFPLVMAIGAVMGILGVPVPAVETGIALSAVILGLMIALAVKAPIWVSSVIVGLFAIFHGYAHGAELPASANIFAYAVGFVTATGLLHLVGIAFGYPVKWRNGQIAVRSAGGLISLAGLAFLAGFA